MSVSKDNSIKNELCALTKALWQYYILTPSEENFHKIYDVLAQDVVMIGTGKAELCLSKEQMLDSLADNLAESMTIHFKVIDEWYECLPVTENVYMVYGGLWVREKEYCDKATFINMDTRFTFIYRRTQVSWELVHLHHSMPYAEQMSGEYYPKTLSEKAKEAMKLAEAFKLKSELDCMTGLYHNESFKFYAEKALSHTAQAFLMMFDFNLFKRINDTYGHPVGDALIKIFARVLKSRFSEGAVLGRLGGDEFACLLNGPQEHSRLRHELEALENEYRMEAARLVDNPGHVGFSTGIAEYHEEMDSSGFRALMTRADKALYSAKLSKESVCFDAE